MHTENNTENEKLFFDKKKLPITSKIIKYQKILNDIDVCNIELNNLINDGMEDSKEHKFIKNMFLIVPKFIIKYDGLNYTEKMIYSLLLSLSNKKNGFSFATNETIANYFNLSIQTVQNAITHLKDIGLISIKKTRFKRKIYIIYDDTKLSNIIFKENKDNIPSSVILSKLKDKIKELSKKENSI